jgi:hypothetical protein
MEYENYHDLGEESLEEESLDEIERRELSYIEYWLKDKLNIEAVEEDK